MKVTEYSGDCDSLASVFLEEVCPELVFEDGLEESSCGGGMEGGHLSRGTIWVKAGRKAGGSFRVPHLPPASPYHHTPFCVPAGGLQAVAELLQVDYEMHKMTRDPLNLALRRYAGMTLTNLTFGDVANKVPGESRVTAPPGLSLSPPHPLLETVLRGGNNCPQFMGWWTEAQRGPHLSNGVTAPPAPWW